MKNDISFLVYSYTIFFGYIFRFSYTKCMVNEAGKRNGFARQLDETEWRNSSAYRRVLRTRLSQASRVIVSFICIV